MADEVIAGTPAAGTPAAAGTLAAGTPAASGTPAAGSSPASGTPAAGAGTDAGTQTPEQIAAAKTAADAETARVAALTPEQKAAEAKAAADKAAAADAPADYSKLTMPEGYSTKPDDAVFGEALKVFGDNKIAPDVAQKLLDFTVTRDKALAQAINDHNAVQWNKQADGWLAATKKEFSEGDLGGAKEVAAKIFDKDALAYLEGLKLTSNPGFVRAMVKISKAIAPDTWVTGNAANGAARTAQALYPNSKMNP